MLLSEGCSSSTPAGRDGAVGKDGPSQEGGAGGTGGRNATGGSGSGGLGAGGVATGGVATGGVGSGGIHTGAGGGAGGIASGGRDGGLDGVGTGGTSTGGSDASMAGAGGRDAAGGSGIDSGRGGAGGGGGATIDGGLVGIDGGCASQGTAPAVARGGQYFGFSEKLNRYYTDCAWQPSSTTYVSPNGTGNGSSRSTPASVATTLAAVVPGMMVVFTAGTYSGCLELDSDHGGSYDSPIVLLGERKADGSPAP